MIRKVLYIFLTIVLILSISVISYAQSYSWYFKPSSGEKVPELTPEVCSFINKYNTITIGNPDEKKIYLTFDAGYENGNVKKIFDTLKEKQVKAAFFILPQLCKNNVDLLLRMKKEGHLVCNHTYSHRDMSKITNFDDFKEELISAENSFEDATGYKMDRFYRPPEGRFSEQNLEWANSLGYTTVFWSLAYADWDNNSQMNPQKALNLICSRTHNGCVALLHPTSATNAAILGDYIDIMRENGYEFCSIEELMGDEKNA